MKNQTKKVLQKTGVILAMVMLFTMLAVRLGRRAKAILVVIQQFPGQVRRMFLHIQLQMQQAMSFSALKKGRNAVLLLLWLTRGLV